MQRGDDEPPPGKKFREEDENESNQCVLSKENEGTVDAEYRDFFPLLALPDELIGNTFSFLSIEDRLRARVNKRLDKIESEYKYYMEELHITDSLSDCAYFGGELVLQYGRDNLRKYIRCIGWYLSHNFIRRLTKNLSIGSLSLCSQQYQQHCPSEFNREVYNIAKDFDVEKLDLTKGNEAIIKFVMVDPFFLEISRRCRKLNLFGCERITPEALHQVYKMMMERSTKLRKMTMGMTDKQFTPLLNLIGGISFRNGKFFAKRNIEAIEKISYDEQYPMYGLQLTRLFDGNLEIGFGHNISLRSTYHAVTSYRLIHPGFSFVLHESNESLAKAKHRKGFKRSEVVVE